MNLDKTLAIAAFLLTLTALWLPWWRVSWDDGATVARDDVAAFRPEPPLTTAWGPWLTGIVAAAAALLLFVRLAAGSRTHEPASWRRDLAVTSGLLVAAVLSCLLWPSAAMPSFWGGRTYVDANATGPSTTETAMPGLGWWLALLAAVLLGIAAWTARRLVPEDPSTASDTSGK